MARMVLMMIECSTPNWAISPLTHAQQLWNQWEIQCLVLASFSLQVFLLFFPGIRKRRNSSILSLLLWLAYLSADYVATFALGRLTLHLNDPRHQLVLFWTPFLLLHLGGQETIAAFSTEDSMLWKRHLLSLVSQVALAVYIVAKSWHASSINRQLAVPVALMFLAGTIKYAERTWALMTAGSSLTPGRSTITDYVLHVEGSVIDDAKSYFQRLNELLSAHPHHLEKDIDYEGLVGVAGKGLRMCIEFLTDMTPFLMWHSGDIIDRTIKKLKDVTNESLRAHIAYKLAEIHLSLIYDFMYTKYGVLQFHLNLLISGIERLITFGATSTALALFVKADQRGHFLQLSRADVMVSYVLLIGAVTLDIISILMVIFSYWPYLPGRGGPCGDGFPGKSVMFFVTKLFNPLGMVLWSGKMDQYNLIDDCIKEKRANILMRGLRKIGLVSGIKSVPVSIDMKKFLFKKLLGIATTRHVNDYWKWNFSVFRGQWLRWELEATEERRFIDTEQLNIEGENFAGTVLLWHITTEMCYHTDKDRPTSEDCRSLMWMNLEMSNYVLYLIAKCGVNGGSNGQFELGKLRRDIKKVLSHERFSHGSLNKGDLIFYAYEGHGFFSSRAAVAAKQLGKVSNRERWELIATVWVEMLCYLAANCETGFHIKNLTTGGEFITHVRILQIILGIPFLREAWQTEAKDDAQYSDFVMF
uniref:DUF4220 domain-containing protein n=1 Tax=Oryza nivara TaxID=4536 RepID=A0A0E0J037_ORYNI